MKKNGLFKSGVFYAIVFLGIIGIVTWATGGSTGEQSNKLSGSDFVTQLKDGKIAKFNIQPSGGVYNITGEYRDEQKVKDSSSGLKSLVQQTLRAKTLQQQSYKMTRSLVKLTVLLKIKK